MKVLKIAAIVVGAAALALTGVGLAAGWGLAGGLAFATSTLGLTGLGASIFTGLFVTTALFAVSQVAALLQPHPSGGGVQEKWKADEYAGIPYAMGRTLVGGNIVYKRAHGKNNTYLTTVTVLGLGPINTIEASFLNQTLTAYSGYAAQTSPYKKWVWQSSQLGACPEATALPAVQDHPPGWGGSTKLSGLAACLNTFKFDQKGKGLTSVPQLAWIVQGVKVYDPRLDSTYPGGSGSCRAGVESTYVYSENPGLHALTWTLGRFQNGHRVAGIGFSPYNIDIATFVECANLCDARGWKVGGQVYTRPDSLWNSLIAMLQAGGAKPLFYKGRITCINRAPRVSLATITHNDVVGDCSFTTTQPRRDRLNGVIPQYRSEDHDWAMVSARAVSEASFIALDGDERFKEVSYPLVQDVHQASQLACYDIYDGREAGPGSVVLKPEFMNYRPGDCVTFSPEDGYSLKCEIMGRSIDAAAGTVSLDLRGETDAKHTYCLALTGTAPPIASLTYSEAVDPPLASDWTLTATDVLSTSGVKVPALEMNGAVSNPSVTDVLFEYGQHPPAEFPGWYAKVYLETDQVTQYGAPWTAGLYVGFGGPFNVAPNGGATIGALQTNGDQYYEINNPTANPAWHGQPLAIRTYEPENNRVVWTFYYPIPAGTWTMSDYDLPEPGLFEFLDWRIKVQSWFGSPVTVAQGGPSYGSAAGHVYASWDSGAFTAEGGGDDFTSAGIEPASVTSKTITGVRDASSYYVRVSYKVRQSWSDPTYYGPVTTGSTVAGTIVDQQPWATEPTPVESVIQPRTNLLIDAGLRTGGIYWNIP